MTPSNQSYTLPSGRALYVGESAPEEPPTEVPAWLAAQTINTWALVPGNTIASIDPKNDPAINPLYPSLPEWWASGQHMVIDAWNSAAVNPLTGDVYAWGGGHADYGGNELYKQNLYAATPTWSILRPPAGAIGNTITDGGFGHNSSSGLYSNGEPRPTHTYNSILYVPGAGFVVTNLYYVFTDVNGPGKAYLFNETTHAWELYCNYTSLGDCNAPVSGSCYDSLRHCIWILGQGAYNMVKIDCTTKVATRHGVIDNHAENPLLKYDAANDLVHIVSSSSSSGWLDYTSHQSVFDPVTSLFHVLPAATGSLPAGLSLSGHAVGWDEVDGCFLIWGAQTNRAKVGTLSRGVGNPRTTAWVAGERTLSGTNTIIPAAPATNGTFGRFDYVPKLGGCFLLNAVDHQTYFYKTKVIS